MKKTPFCVILTQVFFFYSSLTFGHDLGNDSLEVANIMLAVTDEIANLNTFTVHKIEKSVAKNRQIYLFSGLAINEEDPVVEPSSLKIIKTTHYRDHETHYTYQVFFQKLQNRPNIPFRWRDMCLESIGVANNLLAVATRIAALQNFKNLAVVRAEMQADAQAEIYRLSGMEIIHDTQTVIGGFTLTLTKAAANGEGLSHFTVDFDDTQENEDLIPEVPVLTRS